MTTDCCHDWGDDSMVDACYCPDDCTCVCDVCGCERVPRPTGCECLTSYSEADLKRAIAELEDALQTTAGFTHPNDMHKWGLIVLDAAKRWTTRTAWET